MSQSSRQKASFTAWAVREVGNAHDYDEAVRIAVNCTRKGAYHLDVRQALSARGDGPEHHNVVLPVRP